MNNNKTKKLVNDLTNFVNTFNCDHEGFIKEFCSQHRTLQQSTFRLMLMVMEKIASDDYRTDGRNNSSHILAKKLMDGFAIIQANEEVKLHGADPEKITEKSLKEFSEGYFGKPSRYLPTI